MTLSFLIPSRCVLLVGDEALYIYNVTPAAVRLVDSVTWQTDGFEETVIELIRKECGGKPVLILNDMTDQHFKGGQRLPRVGLLDKANVLARKLNVAFPNYPVRGALPIKSTKQPIINPGDKVSVKQTGQLYLFAAVPMSEAIVKTIDTVKKSLSSIVGFYLLPIEASDMVRALATRLAGKGRKVSRWAIFIGQHHNGALRQVIIRDGQLAMTRMTPVIDTDTDFELWAQEVAQEFKATISYLSRFGFSADDGVDLIVVCHPQAGAALEKLIDVPCHYSTFTAPEAARELNINLGPQDEPRYADSLHAAWIGRKNRFVLPMQAQELAKVGRPRQIAAVAIFLLILGLGYTFSSLWTQIQTMTQAQDGLAEQQRALSQASAAYEDEVAKMNALGFDVKLVQGAIATFKELEAKRMRELVMVRKIHEALGDELRLDTLTISNASAVSPATAASAQPPTSADAAAAGAKPQVNATLKLSFPPTIEIETGVREVNNFKHRLELALPGCTVSIDKNVAGLEYSDTFTGEAGAAADQNQNRPQQYVAELSIKGVIP